MQRTKIAMVAEGFEFTDEIAGSVPSDPPDIQTGSLVPHG